MDKKTEKRLASCDFTPKEREAAILGPKGAGLNDEQSKLFKKEILPVYKDCAEKKNAAYDARQAELVPVEKEKGLAAQAFDKVRDGARAIADAPRNAIEAGQKAVTREIRDFAEEGAALKEAKLNRAVENSENGAMGGQSARAQRLLNGAGMAP